MTDLLAFYNSAFALVQIMIAIQPRTRQILGVNQQTYQALKASMSLDLRRQLLIAVCDSVTLQNQLATQLENDLALDLSAAADFKVFESGFEDDFRSDTRSHRLERLVLDPEEGDLLKQVACWVRQILLSESTLPTGGTLPKVQALGIEQMTRQPAMTQNHFLRSLENVESLLPRLNTTLLVWVPRPWLRTIEQSAPTFWAWRNGVFEFVSDPTPTPSRWEALPLDQPLEEARLDLPGGNGFNSDGFNSHGFNSHGLSSNVSNGDADSWRATDWSLDESFVRPSMAGLYGEGLHGEGLQDEDLQDEDLQGEIDHTDLPIESEAVCQGAKTLAATVSNSSPSRHGNLDPYKNVSSEATPDTSSLAAGSLAAETAQPASHPLIAKQSAIKKLNIAALGGLRSTVSQGIDASTQVSIQPDIQVDALPDIQLAIQPDDQIDALSENTLTIHPAVSTDSSADSIESNQVGEALEVAPLTSAQQVRQKAADDYFAVGHVYRSQIEAGERGLALIEKAIAAYEGGLQCLSGPHPDWGSGLNDLGTLYWLKAQQLNDPQQCVDAMAHSIQLYQEALTKADPQQPGMFSQLYSNMGSVYSMLATYDAPMDYLKQAATAYGKALPLCSLEDEPEEYATLQNSLGSVYWKLSHYESVQTYLHQAVSAYNQALLGYSPEQQPLDYAAVQNNLGITYWSLAKHDRPAVLLKHAIAAYRDALNYRTPEIDPAACAITYNNLALAYWDLSKDREIDRQQKSCYQKNAVTAFEAALSISKSANILSQADSAAIYHCLGDVHAQMAESASSLSEIAGSLQKSLHSFIQAIDGLPSDSPAYQGRLVAIVENMRAHYDQLGLAGQQAALNRVPPSLLSQVMIAL